MTSNERSDKAEPNAPRLIVIGNGMVGQRLLEELTRQGSPYDITVFCEEPCPAYDRIQLSQCFGDTPDIALAKEEFFREHGITLLLDKAAMGIDRVSRCVYTADGQAYPYDKLVLATGAVPYIPPTEGYGQPHCLPYRTLRDVDLIKQSGRDSRSGVVIGGGLLGLEAAGALLKLKLETHIVEYSSHLMAMQLDKAGGQLLREKIEAMGIQVHTSRKTQAIETGAERRYRLRFSDGDFLETDMVVFSAGIRPADNLANVCGLSIGERGGVAINGHCQSSDPNIYAIGDVASWANATFGLVAPGYDMARACAAHLLGRTEPVFNGASPSTKLKLLGVEVGSIGDAHGKTADSISCVVDDTLSGEYRKLIVDKTGKRLLGAVLVGNTSSFGMLDQYFSNQLPLPPQPAALIAPAASADTLIGADALPDGAQICSCNNVSKGELCGAIASGCAKLEDLKARTRAGTSCGGCVPLVKQVLDAEFKRLGLEVDKSLCEHFAHSRQELYHLVRVNGIRDFKTLIERHGKGKGCDICKPVAASILASCWNDYVLSQSNAPLQDSNDAFLANLQKDGTYSVVPRIPGGEITPEKLIVIGEVARKYSLYTKITGGQRIDLFGARVEQLPSIWKELVDAGFESGHAYGKALRTAKSCVGSTWCRFGVQDSVGMAIRLEERYRGLRAPHKLKMAVSGCTRECAEAQSKDVGVIATEKGWNLYVCGNGGMRPRHAELLACDLDDAALIKAIDRFLMFYIRTADRLQRTATWREGLEGGLGYLKQVVLADSLGIGDELEAQMQALVNAYECEWARTLKDEKALRRFRSIVNDNTPDEHIVHVMERGQPRPARPEERVALAADAVET
ncbi:nitrite reductase large subunit NirB [Pusillimonas noertemannii]|uniref:Assimilatory nitrite reductase (NAD(P)H) large subunit n=1 Tax=Pusillimonas noertemannii TaxID=305977 RepID=A0A2U1CM25_9BURK|nr:nitrite reductase large subunit NirB [Pusillimonas noertemannii]NYT68925.1 nitrite reductase large subunit [Pusillimonas noertemannii]PVY62055.1 assimilatory nitrite reductase (NAD(P)H) large subunit precursor [Pusillimonas noertemannii]TFL10946.1 nitrite reductase large subunit [Pusillimonas noertemannii]